MQHVLKTPLEFVKSDNGSGTVMEDKVNDGIDAVQCEYERSGIQTPQVFD